MIITTTNSIEKHKVSRYLGVVNANVVLGTNLFSDFAASLTDVFGGRSETYQNKLQLIYKDVMKELEKEALSLNADAILGLNIDFDEVSGGGKSMFMVSASGTAVQLEKETTSDRYAMYRLLNDVYEYWEKGFLSEEEYNYEKEHIVKEYNNSIAREVKVIKEVQEREQKRESELNAKIEAAKQMLENRCPCSEESIRNTTEFQILASNYEAIQYTASDPLEIIIAKFIRLNKIPEACKYYIDDTGLNYSDAIEYIIDIYRKVDLADKETFEKLIRKLKILKDKGFIEQAIREYKQYTLAEEEIAIEYINKL